VSFYKIQHVEFRLFVIFVEKALSMINVVLCYSFMIKAAISNSTHSIRKTSSLSSGNKIRIAIIRKSLMVEHRKFEKGNMNLKQLIKIRYTI
jgi:hypothetical protein